jgi:hypothetical protein
LIPDSTEVALEIISEVVGMPSAEPQPTASPTKTSRQDNHFSTSANKYYRLFFCKLHPACAFLQVI